MRWRGRSTETHFRPSGSRASFARQAQGQLRWPAKNHARVRSDGDLRSRGHRGHHRAPGSATGYVSEGGRRLHPSPGTSRDGGTARPLSLGLFVDVDSRISVGCCDTASQRSWLALANPWFAALCLVRPADERGAARLPSRTVCRLTTPCTLPPRGKSWSLRRGHSDSAVWVGFESRATFPQPGSRWCLSRSRPPTGPLSSAAPSLNRGRCSGDGWNGAARNAAPRNARTRQRRRSPVRE
jgi:hypothetical protein